MVQNLPANAGDAGLISGSGISLGVGNDNPLQYSHLENSMDGRARQATVHWITKSQTQLSMRTHTHKQCSLKVNLPLFTDLFIIRVLPNFWRINRYAQLSHSSTMLCSQPYQGICSYSVLPAHRYVIPTHLSELSLNGFSGTSSQTPRLSGYTLYDWLKTHNLETEHKT